MIRVAENNNKKLIIKNYPTKYWLVCILLAIFSLLINYGAFYLAPIYSSLSCNKGWLNTTNCEIIEYSFGNKDLYYHKIKNLREPKEILRNGTIRLTTEIDLLHNHIKNIYYPSNKLTGFFDLYLYRFHWQSEKEVSQINDFIYSKNNQKSLKLIRKIPFVFYISFLLLPLAIVLSIISILVHPVDTYIFDLDQNNLVITNNFASTFEEQIYSLNQLSAVSYSADDDNKLCSIILQVKGQNILTFNDFTNMEEAQKLFNLIKQYVK